MTGLSSQVEGHQTLKAEIIDSRWKGLYKVGGTAALITVAFIPIQMVVFIAWSSHSFQSLFWRFGTS
jgi:hypothetical protein